jgi:hypothetical protein
MVRTKLLIGLALIVASVSQSAAGAEELKQPFAMIDVTLLGYPKRPEATDREFEARFTSATLNSLDINSRLIALSSKVLIVYATRPDKGSAPWPPYSMRAFFLDPSSGTLIRQQTWQLRPRRSPSEFGDCEGRIYALTYGRYVVCAHDELSLYSDDGTLQRTQHVLALQRMALLSFLGSEMLQVARKSTPGSTARILAWSSSSYGRSQGRSIS